ncbi:hypothetical protein [Novosphingobium lentum]|uniref:hypothetical protein n=1 Tax=Novosphingobium lentum TaxID=145287 RepID=UPI0008366A4B|nr:hypothetical protein [Novosphingobium lentum]
MTALSPKVLGLFAFLVVTQVLGSSLLPRTEGFRNPAWTGACLAVYLVSFWSLAELIRGGAPLGTVIPLLAAVVPLVVIGVGVTIYHEPASWARIGILSVACLLVGYASTV